MKAERARLVGRDRRRRRPASPRTATSSAVEVREVNDIELVGHRPRDGRRPLRLPPHDLADAAARRQQDAPNPADPFDLAALTGQTPGTTTWPVHEVGREPDFFDPKSARLLKAGSSVVSDSVHLHSNGRDTKAHLEIGFKFMPKGYKPEYRTSRVAPRQRRRHRHQGRWTPTRSCTPTRCSPSTPRSCRSSRTSTRPGARMCLEAIWGYTVADAQLRRLRPQLGARLRLRRRPRAAAAEGHGAAHHRLHGQLADATRTCPTRATGRARATARWRTCSSTSATACRSPTSSSWPR